MYKRLPHDVRHQWDFNFCLSSEFDFRICITVLAASVGTVYVKSSESRSSIRRRPIKLEPMKESAWGLQPHVSGDFRGIVVWSSTMKSPLLRLSSSRKHSFCSYFRARQNFIASTIILPQPRLTAPLLPHFFALCLMVMPRAPYMSIIASGVVNFKHWKSCSTQQKVMPSRTTGVLPKLLKMPHSPLLLLNGAHCTDGYVSVPENGWLVLGCLLLEVYSLSEFGWLTGAYPWAELPSGYALSQLRPGIGTKLQKIF